MSAFLTDAQRDFIQAAIRYLIASGGAAKPVDEIISHLLAKNFSAFGFRSEIAFKDALRDDPVKTLLDALLFLDAGPPCVAPSVVVLPPGGGDPGDPFPYVLVTLNSLPVINSFVRIERASLPDFSDLDTLALISIIPPTTVYGGVPASQDGSLAHGTHYYRAWVTTCPGVYSNVVSYHAV